MSASDVHVNLLTIHSDTVFAKYLRFIKQNPGLTRSQILTAVKGPEYNRPGYNSDYFAYFIQKDLVKCVRAGNKVYYYMTSKGNAAVQRADANGPKPPIKKHTCNVSGHDIPFNTALPDERKHANEAASFIQELASISAVDAVNTRYTRYYYSGKVPEGAISKEKALELAKKHGGRHFKRLFTRLVNWSYLQYSWNFIAGEGSKPKDVWVTKRGLEFIRVWPDLGQVAQEAMKNC